MPSTLGRPRARVVRKDGDDLHAHEARRCAAPVQAGISRSVAAAPGALDLVMVAHRHDDVAARKASARASTRAGKVSARSISSAQTTRMDGSAVSRTARRSGAAAAGTPDAPGPGRAAARSRRAAGPPRAGCWRRRACGACPARARPRRRRSRRRRMHRSEDHREQRQAAALRSGAPCENGSSDSVTGARFATASSTTTIATGSRISAFRNESRARLSLPAATLRLRAALAGRRPR